MHYVYRIYDNLYYYSIRLLHVYIIIIFLICILVQAEIINGLTNVAENETNPVIFRCQATGEPIPTINWYFDGVVINVSNTSKYNVTSSIYGTMITSIITIMNTQSSDAGIYTCEAENIIDSDSSSGILTVNGMYVWYAPY